MRLYIPSRDRATEKNIKNGPLEDLPEHTDVSYVVPTDQYDAYREVLPELVGLLCTDAQGIAATRKFIGEVADAEGFPKFAMLDDDIRFLIRKGADDWRLRGTEKSEVAQMLQHVDFHLSTHAHVGISAREGNNRIGVGDMGLRAGNTRTLRFLAYRTGDFLGVEHGRVDVMEDFDVNLQLLRKGLRNTSLHYWAQGQAMTNAPGGCSVYRSHELHERSAHKLVELHPGFVRLRQKENKTDKDGFGTRTEVTIQWKKAFKEGQHYANYSGT